MHPMIFAGIIQEQQAEVAANFKRLSYNQISSAIFKVTGVTFEDIKSPIRKREIVNSRYIFVALMLKKGTLMSLKKLGSLINRDHSTMIYSRDTYEDLYLTDKAFKKAADAVLSIL